MSSSGRGKGSAHSSAAGSPAGSRPASKPASPKLGAAPARRASGTAAAAAVAEAKYDVDGGVARASRPTSAVAGASKQMGRPVSGGPVKAVYRPGVPAPAGPSPAAAAAATTSATSTPRVQAIQPAASSAPAASIRPRRLPNLPPDDSDYDSDLVLSEEETDDEAPLVHPAALPLPFKLTRPDPTAIHDPDQQQPLPAEAEAVAGAGVGGAARDMMALAQAHIVDQPELLPVTAVALEHQSTLLESQGAAVAAALAKKQQASGAGGATFNVSSYSSGPLPSQANDLLYTDAHAPYTYSKHARPMTIWLVGKPLSGKRSLAKRLQQELGTAGAAVLPNGGAQAPSFSGRERDSTLVRPAHKDYSSNIALITPEFLLSHARESSHTPGSPRFPEIDAIIAGLEAGQTVPPETLFKLFVFALHSERVAYHGYILSDLSFLPSSVGGAGQRAGALGTGGVAELAALSRAYPVLAERGVWPPQHIMELEVSDEEIVRRLHLRKSDYIARRLGDVLGFYEPREPTQAEQLAAQILAEDAAAAGGLSEGEESAPPSAPAGSSGGMSRPTSALSRSGSRAGLLAAAAGGVGPGSGDPATDYPAYLALHRPDDVEDYDDAEYGQLSEGQLLAAGTDGALQQRFLRLESESSLQDRLLQYETTRAQLRQLVASWSAFHPAGSSLTLASVQRLHALHAAQPLVEIVRVALHILGQNKWSSGMALAQHLPAVGKEELRPIEEDEIRQLLLLPNLHNSSKESASGAPVPAPQTNDPSGLDLESESAFEHVTHQFGVFQTYCPVSLLLESRMVEGREECAATYQGHIYLMASPVALRKFQENPLRFTSTPPALPGNFVLAVVGAPSVGKTTLARCFATQFGWGLHSLDGSEETLARVAALVASGGQHVLDGGPSTLAGFTQAQSMGLRIDKVAYVFLDDVEVLTGRLRVARQVAAANAPPLSEEQQRAEAEAAAALAAEKAALASPSNKKSKKPAGGGGGASSKAAASSAPQADDEPTAEEEELMDRVDEWQNDYWPNVLLPFLEEHAYACTEVNNSTVVSATAPAGASGAGTAAATPTAAATASSGSTAFSFSEAADPAATAGATGAASGPAQLPPATLQAIETVFLSLRRCVDPFFNYRHVSSARRVTKEMVERSWKEEDRIPLGPPPAASTAPSTTGGGGAAGTMSSAVSVVGNGGVDNPRGLRFQDTTFCPVCLLGPQRLLVPGQNREGVSLGAHSYSCCSAQCATKFVMEPHRYNLNSPERLAELAPSMPPLRILLTGARASGKSHAARVLQQHFGLAYSFSLAALLMPALKSLAASTLQLVLATEAEEAARRAAEKEARRAERKAKKEAEAAARLAAGLSGDEDGDSGDEDGDESDSDLSDSGYESRGGGGGYHTDTSQSRLGSRSQSALASSPAPLEPKDKDILRLYMSTPPERAYEHGAILAELLEEEWFSNQQIEQLLRDIFASHAWVDQAPSTARDHTNAAGWVCEVDLHNGFLLSRLEAVLSDVDPAHHYAKPHVIFPLECSARLAVGRLVATEQERRARRAEGGAAGGVGGGDDEDAEAQSAMLRNLEAKHRLKQEAAEKAAREQREKEEALAAAKAAKPKRFGKDRAKSAASTKGEEKESKKKSKKDAAAAAAAEAEALAAEEKSKEDAAAEAAAAEEEQGPRSPDAASAAAAAVASASQSDLASSAILAGGEKSEADLALEAELEEKKAAAARALEELAAVMSELQKTSAEFAESFIHSLRARPGGFVVLDALSTTSAARLGPAWLGRLLGNMDAFLRAQSGLFQPVVALTMSDANKLLRNGMRSLRAFGTFCPCCLAPQDGATEPVAYDCKLSLTNRGGSDYFPVMWGPHNIVFTCSRAHRELFVSRPRPYLLAGAPAPLLGQRVVVLDSGATDGDLELSKALARKLAVELNLVHISVEKLLERACAPGSPYASLALSARVRDLLLDGQRVPDNLLVQLVANAVQGAAALARGWVLEGFPASKAQARLLKAAGVVPNEVLSVHDTAAAAAAGSAAGEAEADAGAPIPASKRAQRDQLIARIASAFEEPPVIPEVDPLASESDLPLLPARRRRGVSTLLPPVLAHLNLEEQVVAVPAAAAVSAPVAAVLSELAALERFYASNYANLTVLHTGEAPGTAGAATPNSHLRSAWQQSERALALIGEHKRARQQYLQATHTATFDAARPGRVAHLGLTRMQVLQRASPFGDYCNVCWVRDGVLSRCAPAVAANRHTLEYKQLLYRLCGAQHAALFQSNPDAYTSAAGRALPAETPFQLIAEDAAGIMPAHCELQGFCPVTIRESALQGAAPAVVPGSPDCAVCYRGRVYRLRGPREMAAFLALPSVYSAVRLPQKMPPAALAPMRASGSGAAAAAALAKQDSASLLGLGKTLAFMEVEFSALLMKALNSFDKLWTGTGSPAAAESQQQKLRLKFPALPLNSSALLYLSLYLKTHNPRNEPHIKEKYGKKLREFLGHCALVPAVARQYKTRVEMPGKEMEESKEPTPAPTQNGDVADALPVLDEQSLLYDTLRAEMRAYAGAVGSKRDLAQFFERYLR